MDAGWDEAPRRKKIKLCCTLEDRCYRKKREHFENYTHPHLDELLKYGAYKEVKIPSSYKPKISYQTLREQLTCLLNIHLNRPSQEEYLAPSFTPDSSQMEDSDMFDGNVNLNPEVCSYGEKCYRKNPQHFEKFSHPHLNKLLILIGNNEVFIPKEYQPKISHQTLKEQLTFLKEKIADKSDSPREREEQSSSGSSQSREKQAISTRRNTEEERASQNKNESSAQAYRVVVLDRTRHKILDKLIAAAPYNFFLTTISDSPPTHQEMLSLTFAELVDPNLGDLESSLQINFMVQIGWLLAQYHIMGHRNKPMTLLYGEVDLELDRFKHFMTSVKVKPPSPFGSHHTKMMVFSYKDGSVRVVVSTANLVESDWDNRTQGLWISPRCRPLSEGSDTMSGESPTNFKRDLIKYLSAYKLPELTPWIKKLQNVNMSYIRVFFIASVPGSHTSPSGRLKHDWGHPSLARILNEHVKVPEKNSYQVLVQCSSIGSLGPKPESWLMNEMFTTFISGKKDGIYSNPSLKLIYPSFDNIAASYEGLLGGGCLPYSRNTHMKQEWLTSYMCQWVSDARHRTRAPPHIKTYCRVSPDNTKLSYFVLTSANISKAAWGMLSKSGSLNILSYEAGVVFLPQFLIEKDYFPVTKAAARDEGLPVFPMPYDLPVTPFAYSDIPWWIENIMV